jgi:hypothetical protein
MSAFDGAGPEYRQPRYRTILALGLVIVLLIVAIWVAGAWVLALPEATPAN